MIERDEIRKARLTPVVVSHDMWPWPEVLVATDISPQGMFIATDQKLRFGEYVRISFRLGTRDLWEYEARVAHCRYRRRRSDINYSGMGLEILDANAFEQVIVRDLLRPIPPPLPATCKFPHIDRTPQDRRRKGRNGGRRKNDSRKFFSSFMGGGLY